VGASVRLVRGIGRYFGWCGSGDFVKSQAYHWARMFEQTGSSEVDIWISR